MCRIYRERLMKYNEFHNQCPFNGTDKCQQYHLDCDYEDEIFLAYAKYVYGMPKADRHGQVKCRFNDGWFCNNQCDYKNACKKGNISIQTLERVYIDEIDFELESDD